jgi:NADH dehydrogenase FAD-containing subunit
MSVPDFPGVWALGDCAAVPNAYDNSLSPPTAQFADRQGRQLAANIIARLSDRPTRPFSYKAAGQLASIGHTKAVAQLFGVKIAGFVAWLLWRGVYLLKIPTLARKVRLYLEWNWAMFFPPASKPGGVKARPAQTARETKKPLLDRRGSTLTSGGCRRQAGGGFSGWRDWRA